MEAQKSKGLNFTAAETHALLDGVRSHYSTLFGTFSTPGQTSVSAKTKGEIWAAITAQINATGSGQLRSVEQVKLRWKNLKQKATKDQAEAKTPQTGNKPFKAGEFSDTVLDILGGESSHALHGILPASVGESDEPLNLSADYVLLTPVETGEPSTPSSASIAPPGPPLARGPEPEPEPAPERRRRKRHAGDEEAYERLLKMETERAIKQTELAKEQIKLTLLQQKETELKIKLLEKQLDI
ncbi:uncharacterized protein [Centroberyx affinis]|uniref:uncharacterized protein isoform X1 n=1 Tax=Centroberyx affinis TaxID=166261 RepID=UPI003A5C30CB